MEKMTEEQINALPLTDKERKSNEAFAKLSSIIKYYNTGWVPTKGDLGCFVLSTQAILLLGKDSDKGSYCHANWYAISNPCFKYSCTFVASRLAIRDFDLATFIAKNYKQLYKDLWVEDAQ